MVFSIKFKFLLFVVTILSFVSLFYSIHSYSTYDPDSKFQLKHFPPPLKTSSGAVLVIPQQVLQNGTVLPLTLGNHSRGAAIILPQDKLEQGAILPLYLNKSIDSIYQKNSSDNSIIVVPEIMLSDGIIDIKKGNISSGAAIILSQDTLDKDGVLSFKKGNVSEGLIIILTKEILNNRQIIQLPQGGALLPISHANMSQGVIIFLPSPIVEDRIISLSQEKAILPITQITDTNTTDGAIIMLSNKSIDQGGTFQLSQGLDIRSFLHGDNLLPIPDRGKIKSSTTSELKDVKLLESLNAKPLPDNSFFIPKNALPLYLPNNSLLIENSTGISTPIPDNSIFVPNKGPISLLSKSELVVKGNYGPSINLPNDSLIGNNGEILIPLPKVSVILKDRVTPVSEDACILIGSESSLTDFPQPGSVSGESSLTDFPQPGSVSGESSEFDESPTWLCFR